MDKSLENNVLVIQTIQIAPFRTLMTALNVGKMAGQKGTVEEHLDSK